MEEGSWEIEPEIRGLDPPDGKGTLPLQPGPSAESDVCCKERRLLYYSYVHLYHFDAS